MTHPIKVTIVVNTLDVGGAEKLVADQLNVFDRTRFEWSLVLVRPIQEERNFLSGIPKDVEIHQVPFSSFYDIKAWVRFIRVMRNIKPDVVVSHLFFSNTVARMSRLVCGYVSIAVEQNTYKNKTRFQVYLDHALSYVTYAIIAVSRTVLAFTAKQECIPESKFRVIHNAVDVDRIKRTIGQLSSTEQIRKSLGFASDQRIVLNVARLVPQKNHELLIRSFSIFSKLHPEYVLVVLGEGGLRHKLEALIRELGIGDKVLLKGSVLDVTSYYAISDFFVLTSIIEGFAIVGIEAMAAGLPMVSTRTAGPDEYIKDGENGFLVDDKPTSVAQGMERILASNRSQLSDSARLTARQFDIKRNVSMYEDLIIEAYEAV